MVAILVIGLLGLALIWWHNQQEEQSLAASTAVGAGGPVYSPKAPPQAESIIISSIPVVGPIAAYTVDKVGNAIIQNNFLEQHSQAGPNKGQTYASAGILSLNTKQYTYSQVGSGIKKVVEFWNW